MAMRSSRDDPTAYEVYEIREWIMSRNRAKPAKVSPLINKIEKGKLLARSYEERFVYRSKGSRV